MDLKSCYKILEIQDTASRAEIKQAYRDMIGIWHPDRYVQNPRLYDKATEKLKTLNIAYNELITRLTPGIVKRPADRPSSPKNDSHMIVVTCPACQQKNRLKAGYVTRHPRCGACGTRLFQKTHPHQKPGKTTAETEAQSQATAKTARRSTHSGVQPEPSHGQTSEGQIRHPRKRRRFLNKWTLLIIVAGVLLIMNNFEEMRQWLARHLAPITESRYAEYLRKPTDMFRETKDPGADISTIMVIRQLLQEFGYSSDFTPGVLGDQDLAAIRQFRDDFFLSFRIGNLPEITQALQRQRAIVRLQPTWPQIAKDPHFQLWLDQQTITSSEICMQTLASGEVKQVATLVDWYQFERRQPKPMALPAGGILAKGYHKGLAPLTIRTRNDGRHYYLKLLNALDDTVMLSAFIKGGTTFMEHVPVGKYNLKYAVGETWYGPRWLFGPKTVFKKMDQVFEFKIQENEISGYRLDLYLQPMGQAPKKEYEFDF